MCMSIVCIRAKMFLAGSFVFLVLLGDGRFAFRRVFVFVTCHLLAVRF